MMDSRSECRYVLAFGGDAAAVADATGVRILKRLPMVVLVQTDTGTAVTLAHSGEYVAVFRTKADGLRAVSVFDPPTAPAVSVGEAEELTASEE
jgi:hypothetical protein